MLTIYHATFIWLTESLLGKRILIRI
jgi:hypothetical protein